MRKITFGVANSLDNFIARENGAVDWLMWSNEVTELTGDFWQTIDTVLIGRKSYEIALEHTKGKKNPYPDIKTFVFSRTLNRVEDESVEIVFENAEEFVRELKNKPGKDICLMGGGELAKTLFEADLIDEIGFNIHPVLLGKGIRLYHEMSRQINLELLQSKQLKNGCVYVLYKVKKTA